MRKYMIPISVVAFFCGIWIAKDVLVPILLAFLVAQSLIRIAAESWPRTEPLARILGPISTDDLNTRTKPPQTQIVAAKVEGI